MTLTRSADISPSWVLRRIWPRDIESALHDIHEVTPYISPLTYFETTVITIVLTLKAFTLLLRPSKEWPINNRLSRVRAPLTSAITNIVPRVTLIGTENSQMLLNKIVSSDFNPLSQRRYVATARGQHWFRQQVITWTHDLLSIGYSGRYYDGIWLKKISILFLKNCIWKCRLQYGGRLFQSQWVNVPYIYHFISSVSLTCPPFKNW